MKPQRTHANDDGGIDWDKVWSRVQQKHGDTVELAPANDNSADPEREPSRFWIALALIFVLMVGASCIGAVQS